MNRRSFIKTAIASSAATAIPSLKNNSRQSYPLPSVDDLLDITVNRYGFYYFTSYRKDAALLIYDAQTKHDYMGDRVGRITMQSTPIGGRITSIGNIENQLKYYENHLWEFTVYNYGGKEPTSDWLDAKMLADGSVYIRGVGNKDWVKR